MDEYSQKYSENIEALGQSVQYPITSVLSVLGVFLGGIGVFELIILRAPIDRRIHAAGHIGDHIHMRRPLHNLQIRQ